VKKPKELTPDEMERIQMMNAAFGNTKKNPEKTKVKKKVKIKKKVK
jgi:hypothetical protein